MTTTLVATARYGFLFHRHLRHRHLHSFPTRRSSDLTAPRAEPGRAGAPDRDHGLGPQREPPAHERGRVRPPSGQACRPRDLAAAPRPGGAGARGVDRCPACADSLPGSPAIATPPPMIYLSAPPLPGADGPEPRQENPR